VFDGRRGMAGGKKGGSYDLLDIVKILSGDFFL